LVLLFVMILLLLTLLSFTSAFALEDHPFCPLMVRLPSRQAWMIRLGIPEYSPLVVWVMPDDTKPSTNDSVGWWLGFCAAEDHFRCWFAVRCVHPGAWLDRSPLFG
jgi:hypothetical protein